MHVIAKISCYLERGVVTLKLRKEYLNSVTHTTSALPRIKCWTVWYIERYSMSTYTGVTNCQKTVRFFWPTLYLFVYFSARLLHLLELSQHYEYKEWTTAVCTYSKFGEGSSLLQWRGEWSVDSSRWHSWRQQQRQCWQPWCQCQSAANGMSISWLLWHTWQKHWWQLHHCRYIRPPWLLCMTVCLRCSISRSWYCWIVLLQVLNCLLYILQLDQLW